MIDSQNLVSVANAFYTLMALIVLSGALVVYFNKRSFSSKKRK